MTPCLLLTLLALPPAFVHAFTAEVVEVKDGVAAFAREREEAMKALQMQREADTAHLSRPVGRCCLNRGLSGEARWCHKDKWEALVRGAGVCVGGFVGVGGCCGGGTRWCDRI